MLRETRWRQSCKSLLDLGDGGGGRRRGLLGRALEPGDERARRGRASDARPAHARGRRERGVHVDGGPPRVVARYPYRRDILHEIAAVDDTNLFVRRSRWTESGQLVTTDLLAIDKIGGAETVLVEGADLREVVLGGQ